MKKIKIWLFLILFIFILIAGALVWLVVFRDKKAPEITAQREDVSVPLGRNFTCSELPLVVKDASETELFFVVGEERREQLCFENLGVEEICIGAEDEHGNYATKTLAVTVEHAPEIMGIKAIHTTLNASVDYLMGISVQDAEDGDLTSSLTVESEDVKLDTEGVYTACYRVTDSNGVETKETVQVTVSTAEKLRAMITSREIRHNTVRIFGDVNPYDAGVASEYSVEAALEYMRPTAVRLFHQIDANTSIAGAGFLMEITEDAIYICTNRHVMKDYADWEVSFFDGTKATGISVGYSEGYDVGVVKVALADVPTALVEQLMTVHIDLEYWAGLEGQKIDIGLVKIDGEGGVEHMLQGQLLHIKEAFGWGNGQMQTEMKIDQTAGDSGSAIFDGYGNLISMVYGTSHQDALVRNWGVPLDAVVQCYKEITGR